MTRFVVLTILFAMALAQPPKSVNSTGQQKPSSPPPPPYLASGWKPSGPKLLLPERQQQAPAAKDELPSKYGPPTTEIPTTKSAVNMTTPQNATTKKSENLQEEEGVYYIYHPSGSLQKVTYSTANDLKNMVYTAQFKYQDVEPIRDPIYTYDPETLTFREIETK